ncbi:MAG TPA: hypothetical protein VE133_04775, partial [Candidatus Sulfotelmatobacter sp.]|nr:hypothetical protein [Candidatus Sulfotelmatobacter sp.]
MTLKTDLEVAVPPVHTGKKRRWLRRLAIVAAVLLALLAGLAFYLNSDSFRQTVRARVISDLERMSGGKVEIESFTWKLSALQFEIRNVTIHGREAADDVPYAHADRIFVNAKIVSFFSRKISLEKVDIDRAVFHLIVYPDGSTNQPSPLPARSGEEQPSGQALFDLAIKQIAVNNGTLMLNQERIPFNLSGKEISAGMSYVAAEKAYDGHLDLTPVTLAYRNTAPMQAELHLNFLLRNKETEIKSVKLSTSTSHLEGSGSLRNYNNPEILLQYQAALDLPEVARARKVPQLRAGHADLKGSLTYRNRSYSSDGNLNVRGLEWRDSTLRLAGVDASSPYTLTPEKINLPKLTAQLLGGGVQGNVQITNWNAPPAGQKGSQQRGAARLHISGVEISRVAAAVSTARLPLNKIALAGKISGDVSSSWAGSPDRAVSALKLEVNPPANSAPKEVPVTAQLQATYHGDRRTLDLAGLT